MSQTVLRSDFLARKRAVRRSMLRLIWGQNGRLAGFLNWRLLGLVAALSVLGGVTGCSGPQVLNSFSSSSAVARSTNVVFDDATGLKLDVYAPEGARKAPVVIFFFGARWEEGSKDEYQFVGQALAAQGIVAVLPNYRLYPQVRYPVFLQDCARAVRWAHNHVSTYGGDPDKVVVMGHSAGAYNAAMLALDEEFLKGVGGSRAWLKGMIGLSGPYDFLPLTAPDLRDLFSPPEQFDRTQPVVWADGSNPPLLLMHGENDTNVLVNNTRSLGQRVQRAGGPVTTIIYPDLSHSMMVETLSSMYSNRTDVLPNVVEFVRRVTQTPPPKS